MILTEEQLHDCIPLASDRKIVKYVGHLNDTLELFSINTSERIAAFLAQLAHESGNLQYVEELASGSAYEHRVDLGNLNPKAIQIAHAAGTTTGRFYKGRGLIQVTGYYNYWHCGKYLKDEGLLPEEATEDYLVYNPQKLTDPRLACLSAGWFWYSRNLNALADADNFRRITKVINGGYTKQKERLAYYTNNKQVFGVG